MADDQKVLEAVLKAKDEASQKLKFFTDAIRALPPELKAMDSAMKVANADSAAFTSTVAKLTSELSGKGLRQEIGAIGVALEKIGGVEKVTGPALDRLKQRLRDLKDAGGQLPPTLAALIPPALPVTQSQNAMAAAAEALTARSQGLTSALGPLGPALTAIGPAGLAAVGGVAALVGIWTTAASTLVEWTKGFVDAGGKLDDLKMQTDVSYKALQEWAFAGNDVGLTAEQIANAAVKLSVNIENGSDKTRAAIAKIGLSYEELKRMSPEEQFNAVARGIGEMGNAAEQAAVSAALGFGKSGQMLKLFRSDLDEAREAAHAAGAVMSDETVAAADSLGDAVGRAGLAWEGFKTAMVEQLIQSGAVTEVVKALTGFMGDLTKTVRENGEAFKFLFDLLMGNQLKGFATGIQLLNDKLEQMRRAVDLVKVALGDTGDFGGRVADLPDPRIPRDIRTPGPGPRLAEEMETAEAIKLLDKQLKEDLKKNEQERVEYAKQMAKLRFELEKKQADIILASKQKFNAEMEKGLEKEAIREVSNELQQHLRLKQSLNKLDEDAMRINVNRYDMEKAEARQAAQNRALELQAAEKQRKLDIEAVQALKAKGQISDEVYRKMMSDLGQCTDKSKDFLTIIDAMRFGLEEFGVSAANVFVQLVAGIQQGIRAGGDFKKSLKEWQKGNKMAGAGGMLGSAFGAASAAYQSGSVWGGAATGASAAGAASGYNPYAVAGGAVVGGFLGFFGGKAKRKQELEDMRQQLLGSVGGSMDALQAKARALGVDISRAFTTNKPKELKSIMDQMSAAYDVQQQRMAGLKTAMEGLGTMTRGFVSGLKAGVDATEAQRDQFGRLGNYAALTFAGLVKNTGDVVQALKEMDDTLEQLAKAQADFGLEGSKSFQQLMQFREVVKNNQDVADSISGLNQLMQGLKDAGLLTKEVVNSFGQDAVANFQALTARGVEANTALSLMQPTLQQLWQRQRDFGDITDEATLALLNQAEAQGLVGESMMDVNNKILEVLIAIGEVIGADIPAGFRAATDAANSFKNTVKSIPRIPAPGEGTDYGDAGTGGDGGNIPGYAEGGQVNYPQTGGPAILHGIEHILTPSQMASYAAQAASMIAAGPGPATAGAQAGGMAGPMTYPVQLIVDGRSLNAHIVMQMEQGKIAPQRGRMANV